LLSPIGSSEELAAFVEAFAPFLGDFGFDLLAFAPAPDFDISNLEPILNCE
jgi:hypothetical protein